MIDTAACHRPSGNGERATHRCNGDVAVEQRPVDLEPHVCVRAAGTGGTLWRDTQFDHVFIAGAAADAKGEGVWARRRNCTAAMAEGEAGLESRGIVGEAVAQILARAACRRVAKLSAVECDRDTRHAAIGERPAREMQAAILAEAGVIAADADPVCADIGQRPVCIVEHGRVAFGAGNEFRQGYGDDRLALAARRIADLHADIAGARLPVFQPPHHAEARMGGVRILREVTPDIRPRQAGLRLSEIRSAQVDGDRFHAGLGRRPTSQAEHTRAVHHRILDEHPDRPGGAGTIGTSGSGLRLLADAHTLSADIAQSGADFDDKLAFRCQAQIGRDLGCEREAAMVHVPVMRKAACDIGAWQAVAGMGEQTVVDEHGHFGDVGRCDGVAAAVDAAARMHCLAWFRLVDADEHEAARGSLRRDAGRCRCCLAGAAAREAGEGHQHAKKVAPQRRVAQTRLADCIEIEKPEQPFALLGGWTCGRPFMR